MPIEYDIEPILNAYCHGCFPMADSAHDDTIKWYKPEQRGQLSISDLHIPRSLKKHIRQTNYTITINQDFEGVINACAAQTDGRKETWINPIIKDLFLSLHHHGFAHSVEYREDGKLLGGLYGLSLGAIFCGESMFSRTPNASKTALVHLCARLHKGGYQVLDTQFTNPHLEQFGVYEISADVYDQLLAQHLSTPCDFILEKFSEKQILEDYLKDRL